MQIASNARPQDRVGQFDKMGGFDPPVLLMKFRRAPCMGVGFHGRFSFWRGTDNRRMHKFLRNPNF